MTPRVPPGQVSEILVMGAGTIGISWAAWFVSRGLHVHIVDPFLSAARVQTGIGPLLHLLSALQPDRTAGDFCHHTQLNAATATAQFVQECIAENLDRKRGVMAQLEDNVDPATVICTSTSSLLPSDIQAGCRFPGRILAGHPFNPPHLLPLVEVVGGQATQASAVDWAMEFYAALGKFPVRVRKEVVGHVANRLTSALFREAAYILEEGIATAGDVDAVMTQGPGLRWALMGPFLTYHLGGGPGGIRHYLEHLGPTHPARWETLGQPRFDREARAAMAQSVLQAYGHQSVEALNAARDRDLARLLHLKRDSDHPS